MRNERCSRAGHPHAQMATQHQMESRFGLGPTAGKVDLITVIVYRGDTVNDVCVVVVIFQMRFDGKMSGKTQNCKVAQ